MSSTERRLEAIDRILDRGGDADDVLRDVVATLHERAGYPWAGIFFVEGTSSPSARTPAHPTSRQRARASPSPGRATASPSSPSTTRPRKTASSSSASPLLVAGHCLVGWDTGGESWDPEARWSPRARPSPRTAGRRSLGALSPLLVVIVSRELSIPRSGFGALSGLIPRAREPLRSTSGGSGALPRKGYPASARSSTLDRGTTTA